MPFASYDPAMLVDCLPLAWAKPPTPKPQWDNNNCIENSNFIMNAKTQIER